MLRPNLDNVVGYVPFSFSTLQHRRGSDSRHDGHRVLEEKLRQHKILEIKRLRDKITISELLNMTDKAH